jgi:ribosomal protein L29
MACVAVFAIVLLFIGSWSVVKVVHRHQQVADAKNYVKTSQIKAKNQTELNKIRISQQGQLVKVETQKADIRYQKSLGIRKAQDEIAKTLTPLYVQFEMIQALEAIAHSGKNSSVIYIPSGAAGIPFVAGANGAPQVTGPGSK